MIKPEVKELVKKYTYLCSWYEMNDGNQSISVDQFETVANEIGRLETELIKNGVSESAIDKILTYIKNNNLADKPIKDLTEEQQLRLFKAIFGEGSHWQEEE